MRRAQAGTIAIIGGTGALGSGLARRLAAAGYTVVIGSRSADKAQEAAAQALAAAGGKGCRAAPAMRMPPRLRMSSFVTVPWASQAAILEEIEPHVAGKLVIDTTVPLVPPKVARVQLPAEASAALAGPEAAWRACAWCRHSTTWRRTSCRRTRPSTATCWCSATIAKDREVGVALAKAAGLRGVHAGPLANSVAAEALTSVLIGINRTYKVDGAGIRITGIARD